MSKMDRKELRRPDRFQSIGLSFLAWAMRKKQFLIMVLVACALLVVGGAVFTYWQSQKTDERREALASIEKHYAEELEAADKKRSEFQTQLDELEKPLAASGKEGDAQATTPPVDPAKKMELEAKIKAVKADHTNSLAQYQDFAKKHPNDPEGWLARMRAGTILIEKADFAGAKAEFQEVVSLSKKNTFYQFQSRLALIGILEDEKDFEGAIRLSDELQPLAQNDELKAQVLWIKGNALQLKGDKPASQAVYSELSEKYPTSREAGRARAMLSIL